MRAHDLLTDARRRSRVLLVAALVLSVGCTDGDGDTGGAGGGDAGGPPGAGGGVGGGGTPGGGGGGGAPAASNPLAPRVENTTCRLPVAPPLGDMTNEEVWSDLNFTRPLWLGAPPEVQDQLFVVEQGGRILVFDPDPATDRYTEFLRIDVSRNGNEEGLLGLAFHPRYVQNGRFFVYYSALNPRRSVISEFRRDADDPGRADPSSERVLLEIEQPFSNHNGGDMHFGPDGHLYISVGDGGSGGDPFGHGQNPTTLLGTILRIDVDQERSDCNRAYGIPHDNPWADAPCNPGADQGRAEIYAWGLRNVWRMAFDRSTGELWAADVGQNRLEEVSIITRGGNFGWATREGDSCFGAPACEREGLVEPIHTYDHSQGRSITGGFVYRGNALPELWGQYVFADFESGRIWALEKPSEPGAEAPVRLLVDTQLGVASFGEDANGELYIVAFNGGASLHRLTRATPPDNLEPFPQRLSETGCFADTSGHTLAAGVIPYEVNVRLWSDGADKLRFFALPEGGRITVAPDGRFVFPEGSVTGKTFTIQEAGRDQPRRLETRLMVRRGDRWQGFTWKWNAEQTDAELLPGALTEAVTTPAGEQVWDYPSRAQCDNCHTEVAGGVLGLSLQQQQRMATYEGGRFAQIDALAGAGYLDLNGAPTVEAFPELGDESASLEKRARALLEVNCAMCHVPGGNENTVIDLRAATPLGDTKLCDPPTQGDLNIGDAARLIVPGDPESSVLIRRMTIRDGDQMPPLASRLVDSLGTAVVGSWISEMGTCP